MKIKQIIFLSILVFSFNCYGMDEDIYGNVEIYNNSGMPLKIKFFNVDTAERNNIVSANLANQSTLEGHLGQLTPSKHYSYQLEIEDNRGDITKYRIIGITNKNNIFIDVMSGGNFGFGIKPFSSGIINPKSRRQRSAKGNIARDHIMRLNE